MAEKKWVWDDLMDHTLKSMYDPTVNGRSQQIAEKLRVPRWAVNRRAVSLGLSRPKDRPWSPAEQSYLEANFHHVSVKALARKLQRSPTAVKLKAKRLGFRKYGEGYTALSLAEALGVDPHWVLARIRSGRLRATPRHTERIAQQGGDSWFITDEGLVGFLREYPYELDLRKVDSLWFMDLVVPYLQRENHPARAA